MSAAIDAVDVETLEKVIAKATPEQRRYLVEKLLPKVIEEDRYLPRLVHNAKGELVGVLVPEFHSTATEPPTLTPEEQAELDRRLATLDDTISHEEMLKRLGLADVPVPRRL
jgi:hypothetical protein